MASQELVALRQKMIRETEEFLASRLEASSITVPRRDPSGFFAEPKREPVAGVTDRGLNECEHQIATPLRTFSSNCDRKTLASTTRRQAEYGPDICQTY
jgi:hypothetical protein